MQLHRAVDLFLMERRPTTRRTYSYTVVPMRDFVGPSRSLDQIGTDHLLEFVQSIKSRPSLNSPASVNKHIKTMRTFFNWCVRMSFVDHSPAAGLRLIPVPRSIDRSKAMPDTAYKQLVDYAKWTPRYFALVLFIGDTGCRIGGAAGLRWSDIDLDQNMAMVSEKGRPPRPVFFGDECRRALLLWRAEQTLTAGDHVFQKAGRRMNNDSLGQLFEKICRRAGIGSWGPHSLRHRKGHQLADNRTAPTIAAQALGHENAMTTLEYYYPKDWDRVREELARTFEHTAQRDEKVLKFRAE